MSFPSIIVPLDGSAEAEFALPFAHELAAALNTDLRVVHVVEPDHRTTFDQDTFEFYVGRLQSRHGIGRSQWLPLIEQQEPAPAIVNASNDAGLIVIASHGRGGFKASIIGSVADRVVRESRVPVFFVPLRTPIAPLAHRPVVVGLDESEDAESGLTIARVVGNALASPLHLVEAYSASPVLQVAAVGIDLLGMVRENAAEYLAGIASPGDTSTARYGTACEVLLNEGETLDAAMIVVARHGTGFAHRLVLGSTTEHLMHTAHRPLLIVPAPVGSRPARPID